MCFALVNALIYLKSFAKYSKAFKILTIYLIITIVIEVIAFYVGKAKHLSNLYFSHFYYTSQFLLLSFFYAELFKKKIILLFAIPVFCFIGYQFFIDPELFFRYNPMAMTITHTLLVIYTIGYLYKSLQGKREFIIVNVGLLIYLLSSTLIFASGNLVLDLNISKSARFLLINLNRVLILVFQILIFIEWYRNYRVQKV